MLYIAYKNLFCLLFYTDEFILLKIRGICCALSAVVTVYVCL